MLGSIAAFLAAAGAAGSQVPRVTIVYYPVFEEACARLAGTQPDPVAAAALRRDLAHYRDVWAKQGPPLLAAARRIVGKPFDFAETLATLHSCKGMPSTSAPLLINMRPNIAELYPPMAANDADFVDTLFHELLHRYIGSILRADSGLLESPLLRRHAAEPVVLRNHLHLFALETLAYRALGRTAELDHAIALDESFRNGPLFKRAREIVAEEGAERFVEELRRPSKR